MTDDILHNQLTYYKKRAPEYDEWWTRQGRHSEGIEKDRIWFEDVKKAGEMIRAFIRSDDLVLEVGCGTGNWSQLIVEGIRAKMTCVDGDENVIKVLQAKFISNGAADYLVEMRFFVQDVFSPEWQPLYKNFTCIFLGFFLSHIPPSRLSLFIEKLKSGLKDGGRIVFVDSYFQLHERAVPILGSNGLKEGIKAVDYADGLPDETFLIRRKLNDGTIHHILKVCYEPHVIKQIFAKHGIAGEAYLTDKGSFLIGNFSI